jgi:hypothetical protein
MSQKWAQLGCQTGFLYDQGSHAQEIIVFRRFFSIIRCDFHLHLPALPAFCSLACEW